MENSISDRIRKLLEYKGLTQNELGEMIGVSGSSVGHWLNKRNEPKKKALTKIVHLFKDVSETWLFYGQGEMLRSGGASLITNEDWATTAAKNMLNEGQEDYNNHSWTAPANENDTPQSLIKKLRERDAIIDGMKKELDKYQDRVTDLTDKLLKLNDEMIDLLKKK